MKKYSLRQIATILQRKVSCISYEIKNNSTNGSYDPHKAQHKAYVKRLNASYRGKKIVANSALKKFVDQSLSDGQSAEGIAGRLKYHEKYLPYTSKDTIYRYMKSPHGKLIGIKWKKKIKPKKSRCATQLADRIFIDKRPKFIEKRTRIGDMEADFIVSGKNGKGIMLTTTCRRLRCSFLELITDVSIDEVHNAFIRIQKRFPEMKTLTLDNDILFRMHRTLEKILSVKIYFCHPYHSWEKGGIENTNMEIRKFIPKGSDLSKYDTETMKIIEQHLNGRFMKCLKYATPEERIMAYRKQKTASSAVII